MFHHCFLEVFCEHTTLRSGPFISKSDFSQKLCENVGIIFYINNFLSFISMHILLQYMVSVSYFHRYYVYILHGSRINYAILVLNNYNKSLFSTLQIDNTANPKDIAVSTRGNTALSANAKSPTFAWVRKISKNEVIMVAFEL